MALTFPSSPSNGQQYNYNGDTYIFDGKRWKSQAQSIDLEPFATDAEVASAISIATSGLASTSYVDTQIAENGGGIDAHSTDPSNPAIGETYYNTTDNDLRVWSGTKWETISLAKLGSVSRPASSAQAIKDAGDDVGDGFYYINVNGTPTQVWCDMTHDGGGWMLAMKTLGASGNFTYDNAYWTNGTTISPNSDANSYNGDIKTTVYTSMPFSSVRLCMGSTANGLVEYAWSNSTSFASFMSSGSSSSNSRTAWLNWASAGGVSGTVNSINSSYPNCNQIGTNRSYNYQYVRIGGTFNNEGDCSSNDASVGFGLRGISPYTNNHSCGGQTGHSTSTATGWIFVK